MYDAPVDLAPLSRSSCRHCDEKSQKGALRHKFLLQYHEGCKNSEYFHTDCFYQYSEIYNIESVNELHGLNWWCCLKPNENLWLFHLKVFLRKILVQKQTLQMKLKEQCSRRSGSSRTKGVDRHKSKSREVTIPQAKRSVVGIATKRERNRRLCIATVGR